ncbi:MAG: ABC transporter substrate-binding protein [Anaerolineaceae bacterium]|nr:ABC transporter substrate-binding protein [Anaerolineaceae bacterium]
MIRKTVIGRSMAVLAVMILLMGSVFVVGAQGGGTLSVGMDVPVVLDPAQGSNDPEVALNRAIYDRLVDIGTDASINANLATDWTVSDDGLTYTFNLVDNATFQDGSPFTSADVVYTYNRLKDVGSAATRLLGDFKVAADGDYTVVFTISQPNADFLYGIGSQLASIIKDGTTEPNVIVDGDNPYVNFNGTGPFVLQSLDANAGGRAVLVRNENYWKSGEPLLDQLEFVYFSGDIITQLDALNSGEVDLIFKVPLTQVVDGVADGLHVVEATTGQHAAIRLRADIEPGNNPLVREAFKYATNRDELNDILLDGRGVVANNDPIGPAYGAYYDATLENQSYDPAQACSLLAEAGYPDGLNLTLYAPIVFEYPDLAVVLQDQWKQACINVEVETLEPGLYYDTSNEVNYCDVTLGITGWGHRPTPQLILLQGYVTSAIDEGCINGYNDAHWSDAELDALVAQAGVTADPAARADLYHQIEVIFRDRGPVVVPYFAPLIGVARDTVQGLNLDPFPGLTDYRTVSVEG